MQLNEKNVIEWYKTLYRVDQTMLVSRLVRNIKNNKGEGVCMSSCEKCWGDAYLRSYCTGISQGEAYQELLVERRDNPCTEKEQAGQFWDEDQQIDTRNRKFI
ncbi:MAG: hypothetical protein WC343_11245 [Bacilli bacterium]|jgi:hypothetical protein